jgi:DNA repair protein RecN (Recombination protein N)
MLTYLHVKNLALIDEAEVEFGPGLNILTGETGAGKSILMGSVNLALGQKMSREMLRDEEKPALVELIFQVDNPRCVERLKEKEISVEEGQIIISRKLTGNRLRWEKRKFWKKEKKLLFWQWEIWYGQLYR